MLTIVDDGRWRAARAFVVLGIAAVIAGGLLAAVAELHPTHHFAWASAYLVLIVGVVQIVFGAGQAALSDRAPAYRWASLEWLVFNLGNAGVIGGQLTGHFPVVLAGTALVVVAIAMFLATTRGHVHAGWLLGYRILLGLIFMSSLIGLVLSIVRVG